MATAAAIKLCPQAVLIRPRFEAYEEASSKLHKIFRIFTDIVEPLSLDEAYLDVTQNKTNIPSATKIARLIKDSVKVKLRLTASAGVSFNKFLAKAASGFKKPDGLTVVTPDKADEFISKLPIGAFFGVGKVTEKKMLSLGIRDGACLREKNLNFLVKNFGKSGRWFYDIARGIDNRPVETGWERLSFGRETTYREDTLDLFQIRRSLDGFAEEIREYLSSEHKNASTLTVKIKYHDFTQVTRSMTVKKGFATCEAVKEAAYALLAKTEAGKKKVRLAGLSASGLFSMDTPSPSGQLGLPF
jgi:DNA polymerase-4